MRKTPIPVKADEVNFKLPVKAWFGRKFYDHDGSCGGGLQTFGTEELPWIEGLLTAGNLDPRDRKDLEKVAQYLRDGHTVDMWFEH